MRTDRTEMQQKINTKIRNKTAGDDWTIRRRVPNVPSGQQIAEAWFTVKENLEQEDSAAIIQKHVTSTVEEVGVGQIEQTGASGTAIIRFDLVPSETVLLKPWMTYYYDFQVLTNIGKYDTPDDGTIIAAPQVTRTVNTA